MRHVFRSLRHRNFRLFYFGQLVSLTGTWMQSLAQAWLLYRLTQSGLWLGIAGAATLLPSLFLGLYGGVLADRFPRRILMMGAQWLALVQALVLGTITALGVVQPWHVLALALMLGLVQAFELPARTSLLSQLVPREDLANAVGLNASLFHLARFFGPALAGVLVAAVGEAWVFFINAFTFLAVLAGLSAIRLPARERAGEGSGHIREGLHYAWQHRPIRAALGMVAVVSLLGSAVAVLLPVFAVEVYRVGVEQLGLLMSAVGAGAVVGALRLAGRRSLYRLEHFIGGVGIATGVGLVLFGLASVFWMSLAILVGIGYCITSTLASSNAFIQMAVADHVRGRVMSLFAIALHGVMPVGQLVVGAGADVVGPQVTVVVSGLMLVVAAWWFGGPLRHAAQPRSGASAC